MCVMIAEKPILRKFNKNSLNTFLLNCVYIANIFILQIENTAIKEEPGATESADIKPNLTTDQNGNQGDVKKEHGKIPRLGRHTLFSGFLSVIEIN